MWWLAIVAAAVFGRKYIARFLGPLLPNAPAERMAWYAHCIALVTGIIYVFPVEFVGLGMLKRPAYLGCLYAQIGASLLMMKALVGPPPIPADISFSNFKEKLHVLQPWLQNAMMKVDFHMLFFSLIFVTAYPSIWALAILLRRSLWTVCLGLQKSHPENKLWLMFKPRWDKLYAQNAKVVEFSAISEIMLGFWLIVSLFLPMRQILCCFIYWNYLKMRYQVPKSHETHGKAWAMLEMQASPVISKLPILNKPLDMAKKWFAPQYA